MPYSVEIHLGEEDSGGSGIDTYVGETKNGKLTAELCATNGVEAVCYIPLEDCVFDYHLYLLHKVNVISAGIENHLFGQTVSNNKALSVFHCC